MLSIRTSFGIPNFSIFKKGTRLGSVGSPFIAPPSVATAATGMSGTILLPSSHGMELNFASNCGTDYKDITVKERNILLSPEKVRLPS